MSNFHDSLKDIVESVDKKPTIVNPESKFVVITYWWGRDNINNNIARPCIDFYEDFLNQLIDSVIQLFKLLYSQTKVTIKENELLNKFADHIIHMPKFKNFINDVTNVYFDIIYTDLGYIDNKDPNRFGNALYDLNIMKTTVPPESPEDFVLFDDVMDEQEAKDITRNFFKNISYTIMKFVASDILEKFSIITMKNILTDQYKKKELNDDETLATLKTYKNEYDIIVENIKKKLKIKTDFDVSGKKYNNMNIYDILNEKLRFRSGKKFQHMIDQWEKECQRYNCNYLSIEYPAQSWLDLGGYQIAINAKPIFINHALKLCENRAVLYIDGDEYIKKYPSIFDMDNVDFMARGWNMDPRGKPSDLGESIMYDPYKFETSGGIMYYSQTPQSKELLELWTNESVLERNKGKADDRIISLIVNSKKLLLNMNIIQLPIEYLWLTLSYNDYMLNLEIVDGGYDWDIEEMKNSLIVEHPECLTTEDTAAGAGASSNRTPKYHAFLDAEESIDPVSEQFYEYLFFPDENMISSFSTYLNFMRRQPYLDDGNHILIEKNFVFPGQPKNENEYPLYIINYNDRYGKRNDIAYNNSKMIEMLKYNLPIIESLKKNIIDIGGNTILLLCENDLELLNIDDILIPLIILLISDGYNVIYRPSECNPDCYVELISNRSKYMDMTLFPIINDMEHILKPVIDLSMPIYFSKSTSDSLIDKILLMFSSLEDLSNYLSYGSYQIISRIRIEYTYKKSSLKDNKKFMNICNKDKTTMIKSMKSYKHNSQSNIQFMPLFTNPGMPLRLAPSNKRITTNPGMPSHLTPGTNPGMPSHLTPGTNPGMPSHLTPGIKKPSKKSSKKPSKKSSKKPSKKSSKKPSKKSSKKPSKKS